ncbi:SH3-like domain-containing protein [Loktanella fryxellensis]|uniref:SH3-like domain-containing protein n=1 Tax=Loktanella fryxellensis TaxID=245187 RepID=A0A1H8D6W7_9RHOB|nr:SH3 domain-containing protein [Loktanella fryxellensis]SEN03041.1 SH3-like domain-containing protein [Loktanella fryxellensis]
MTTTHSFRRCMAALLAATLAAPLAAQDAAVTATTASFAAPVMGPETNLPLPRYVSLKAKEANVRRGPSLTHRIDWVFQRRDMPLQVVAEYGLWRRVIDREGQGGWVHYTMLSGSRTVIVDQDRLPLRTQPSDTAAERAELELNVIARLGDCDGDWCELTAGGYSGWAQRHVLWGVDPAD